MTFIHHDIDTGEGLKVAVGGTFSEHVEDLSEKDGNLGDQTLGCYHDILNKTSGELNSNQDSVLVKIENEEEIVSQSDCSISWVSKLYNWLGQRL